MSKVIYFSHKRAPGLFINVESAELAHENNLMDSTDINYYIDADNNAELLKIAPRLAGRLRHSKVVVIGEMEKDYYFGDKHLVYGVEDYGI